MSYASYSFTCKNYEDGKCVGCPLEGRDPVPKCYENYGVKFVEGMFERMEGGGNDVG